MDAKARAEKLITIFINQCVSTDADAGFHCPSQIEWCEDVSGKKAQSSGQQVTAHGVDDSGGCKDPDIKMISEMRYLREAHAEFELIKFYLSEIHRVKPDYYYALISIPWYTAVYKEKYTVRQAAIACGVTIDAFRSASKQGYNKLIEMIEYDWRRERSVA